MASIFHDTVSHAVADDHQANVFTRRARPTERVALQPSYVECGAGWYHDDAIANERGAHAHPYR